MTRKEQTGKRDLYLSGWCREKLPDSCTGFAISDIDFFIWNWKKKQCMFIEVKTRSKGLPTFQSIMFRNIERWIKKGIDADWTFFGFHFIMFQNTSFDDGNVYYDNEIITEDELIKILSMESF